MEDKVLLFDSNNNKMGETFVRRAKQLVKQERAEWVDESHTAIKFFKDLEENWENESPEQKEVATTEANKLKEEAALYKIAKKRLRERKMFILHTVAFVPMYFFFLFLDNAWRSRGVFLAFMAGSWTTAFIIHACYIIKKYVWNGNIITIAGREERYMKKLTEEVNKLKKGGFSLILALIFVSTLVGCRNNDALHTYVHSSTIMEGDTANLTQTVTHNVALFEGDRISVDINTRRGEIGLFVFNEAGTIIFRGDNLVHPSTFSFSATEDGEYTIELDLRSHTGSYEITWE
ncbi:MAG: PPC domain-containing protein [Defluviitaleaceae bacterium]|nr:PPC domain-containing protein [Defluviitaleaceae bacterium]